MIALLCGCATMEEFESDLTLDELQNRMELAMDPDGRFAKAESYYQKQMLRVYGIFSDDLFDIHIKYKKPNFLKVTTLKYNQRETGLIFNSGAAWSINYKEKTVKPITGTELVRVKIFYDLMNPSTKYQNLFKYVALTRCKIEDKTYYRIVCRPEAESKNVLTVYVDTESYLTQKLEFDFQVPYEGKMRNVKSLSNITAYEIENNVMYPLETSTMTNDVRSTTTVYEYLLDVNIEDSEFRPPIFAQDTDRRQMHRTKMLEKKN